MNKAEFLATVQKSLGQEATKADAARALDAVLEAFKQGLKKNKAVQLVGFGTFKVVTRKARKGINPKTRETIKIKASKSVRFTPGKALKALL